MAPMETTKLVNGKRDDIPFALTWRPDYSHADLPLDKAQIAAWQIEDAMRGLEPIAYPLSMKKGSRENYLFHLHASYYLYVPLVAASLVLSVFEVPLWCDNGNWWTFSDSPSAQCPTADGSAAYFSEIPFLPKAYAAICEAGIILGLFIIVAWQCCLGSVRRDSLKNAERLRLLIVTLMVLEFGLFFLFNNVYDLDVNMRLAPFLRCGLFLLSDTMRPALVNVFNMIREFLNVAVLLFGTVLFFAWVAAMALDDVEGKNHAGQDINDGFSTLPEALYSLFEASTTQNFPDQMLPSFIKYRFWFFFFMVFMFLTVMIFLNLVLAVVYNAYSASQGDQMQTFFKNRARTLASAFRLISKNDVVDKSTFTAVVGCLNRSPVFPQVTKEDLELYWDTLDADDSETIDKSEFFDMCDILQFRFKRVPKSGWLSSPPECLVRFVRGTGEGCCCSLDCIINHVLFINSFLVLVESLEDLGNLDTSVSSDMWATIEFGFSFIYIFELILRLSCISFNEYWDDNSNKFDFAATMTLFVIGVLWADPDIYISDQTLRYFTILRLLRLLRLLASMDTFGFICQCIWRMLLASKEAIGLLFACMYVYSALGVMIFGGLIYDGNADLEGTDYRDSNYDILNFNDFGLGMISLFVNLITAFVPEFYEAFSAVSKFPMVAVIFWVSFYVIGVLVVFNVFASFIIDIFLAQYENAEKSDSARKVEDGLKHAEGQGSSDFKVLSSFVGSDDIYKAMFMEEDGEEAEEGDI